MRFRIKIHISNVKLPFYPPCEVKCRLQNGVSTAGLPFVLQLDTSAYAGKSFMIHNNAACIWNDFLEDTSNVFTPTSYNSFNSSTRSCKYISISFSGEVGQGINNHSMKEDLFIHIHGGRLYGIKMTAMYYEYYSYFHTC